MPGVDLPEVFREARSPVLAAGFGRLASNPNPRIEAIGLCGLINTADPSVIQTLRQDYSVLSKSQSWRGIVDELRWHYTTADPSAQASVGALAADGSIPSDLRAAAAAVLARIHSRPTLPYLVALLDDPSSLLVSLGVSGLSEFANDVPVNGTTPSSAAGPYRTEETLAHAGADQAIIVQRGPYFVNFWKSWWQANQARLTN